MTPTPELDKLRAARPESEPQGAFLDWLTSEKGFTLCTLNVRDQFCPDYTSIERLLAEYHGIDLDVCEHERRAILEELAKQNG